MKKILLILLAAFLVLSCDNSSSSDADTGFVTVNLTDAPVSTDGLLTVNINVTEIRANIAADGDEEDWQVLKTFDPGLDINLLDYTGGISKALAEDVELPSGKVNQIRFMLNSPEEGEDGSNPGCYLGFDDENGGTDKYPLFIPSGSSSGFKAVGSFDIPVNGNVTVTADFDARKSLIEVAEAEYKLKPTIRLVIDNEAGKINGEVTMEGEPFYSSSFAVYAYEADTYTTDELDEDDDGIGLTGAVNSSPLKEDGSYVLPFLEAGTYDIVVAEYWGSGDGYGQVLVEEDITVEAGKVTTLDLELSVAEEILY